MTGMQHGLMHLLEKQNPSVFFVPRLSRDFLSICHRGGVGWKRGQG